MVIEAVQFDGTDESCDWLLPQLKSGSISRSFNKLHIKTLEGTMTADLGDWIIKGVNGEFYPCKPDIFDKTYEAVEKGKSSNTPECYKSNNSTYPLCKGIDEKQECRQCNLYEDMDESNFWDIK